MNFISELPSLNDLKNTLPTDGLAINGFDGLDSDTSKLSGEVDNIEVDTSITALDADIPANLNKVSVEQQIMAPLNNLKGVSAEGLKNDALGASLPIDLPKPGFDLNAPMKLISDQLLKVNLPQPNTDQKFPGFDSVNAVKQLKRLADAGSATPMRIVTLFMKIAKSFLTEVTDPEQLFQFTVESLEEIFVGQLRALGVAMPVTAVTELTDILNSSFLDQYANLLEAIEKQNVSNGELARQAHTLVIPSVKRANQSIATLKHFAAGDGGRLALAIEKALEFTGEGEVFLKEICDQFEAKLTQFMKTVTPPVMQIGDMADKVETFLIDSSEKAKDVSATVSDRLQESVSAVNGHLKTAEDKVGEIEDQITAVLEKIDVTPVVNTIKSNCMQVGEQVETLFSQINELKAKLKTSVNGMGDQVDGEMEAAFSQMEKKIRELLAKITAILERPDVKDALSKAKEGIETFKGAIENVSLKPVFDMAIAKTNDLEAKVEAINVDKLGVPQKTAIKVGAKVIKEVKVDEIIKPELIAIFKELQQPIVELIQELENGVLQVIRTIDKFEPGSIIIEVIETSDEYKALFDFLDAHLPSELLKPLKDANKKLAQLIEKLDPNLLINELQTLYGKVYEVVEILSPRSLNKQILSSVEDATKTLAHIRDFEIKDILKEIKEAISLEKLLEGAGLSDIANAEIWDQVCELLGGKLLNEIPPALTTVETELDARKNTLGFKTPVEEINKMQSRLDAGFAATSTSMKDSLAALLALSESNADRLQALNTKRADLLMAFDHVPELKEVLRLIELTVILEARVAIRAVSEYPKQKMTAQLKTFNAELKAKEAELRNLDKATLQKAISTIFKAQVSQPTTLLIKNIQKKLEPFTETVAKLQRIVQTLAKIPAEMDTAIAGVLDAAASAIEQTLTQTIQLINTTANSLIETIATIYETIKKQVDAFSPYSFLNSFSATDFEENGLSSLSEKIVALGENPITGYIYSTLDTNTIDLLKNKSGDWQSLLITALNDLLADHGFSKKVSDAKNIMAETMSLIVSEPAGENVLFRLKSLDLQLYQGKYLVDSGKAKKNDILRINRVIIESVFPDDVKMSLQSVHPFITSQIAELYPEEVMKALDGTYLNVVDKIKTLPKRMIQDPLDDEFKKVKVIFSSSFDIVGIFTVLRLKMDGVDDDLSQGLDRLSYAFNHMIGTLDARLAE